MPAVISAFLACLIIASPSVTFGQHEHEEVSGLRPLLAIGPGDWQNRLPEHMLLLDDPASIEAFLHTLDDAPPDWPGIYGIDGSGHDERLFALNRQRDGLRDGRAELRTTVTFIWPGGLSQYDPHSGGFRVAIGPKLIPTHWGMVRFKPEGLPSNLLAVASPSARESLRRRMATGGRIEVQVAITGRLIPEESIIYDFGHEEQGRGMVMPVVRVERVDYFLAE